MVSFLYPGPLFYHYQACWLAPRMFSEFGKQTVFSVCAILQQGTARTSDAPQERNCITGWTSNNVYGLDLGPLYCQACRLAPMTICISKLHSLCETFQKKRTARTSDASQEKNRNTGGARSKVYVLDPWPRLGMRVGSHRGRFRSSVSKLQSFCGILQQRTTPFWQDQERIRIIGWASN